MKFDANWFCELRPGEVITHATLLVTAGVGPVVVIESPKPGMIPGTGSMPGFIGVGLYPNGLTGRIAWYSFYKDTQWYPFDLTEKEER